MLSNWTKRHSLAAYFLLAFAISWVLISPLVLQGVGWLPIPLSPNWHFLGALGPLLAALIVTRVAGGKSGLRELAGRLRQGRIGPVWLLIVFLSPFLLFVVSILAVRIAGDPWPDFGKLASPDYANFGWIFGSILSAISYGIGEETGWRGFALPRLQARRGALSATFILCLFWALWHIPMFFYRFEFGVVQVVGFFIGLFAGAIWLTFLYNSTGGSVFAVATWHMLWNIVNIIGLVVAENAVSVMSAIVMVAAVVIIIVWRPARLSIHDKYVIASPEPEVEK